MRKPGKRSELRIICLVTSLAITLASAIASAAPNLFDEFNTIDTNDDGLVSSSEYEVYTRTLFDQMDSDADDKLTSAEIMASEARFNRYVFTTGAILGPAELTTAERIQRIDVNGDGTVSQSEYASATALKFQHLDQNHNGELGFMEFEP